MDIDKEKLIDEISHALQTAGVLLKRIRENDNDVHGLDMELLLGKTREIYDKLIQLNVFSVPLEMEEPENEEPESDEYKEPEFKTETAVEEEFVEQKVQEESTPEVEVIEEKPEPENSTVTEESDDEVHETTSEKSTIDLFTTAEPTISDQYSERQTTTIADQIQKEGINELREAIGINEKFLFINELFNGDMARYNKVIDELDELPTIKGVETYLLELKIHNQWTDDMPAYLKLHALLKRKFSE